MKKNIVVRTLEKQDISKVVQFYNANHSIKRSLQEFHWAFMENPMGEAVYVIAKDLDHNKIVGTQCALPFYLENIDKTQILTAKSEDTFVDQQYRGLGLSTNMYDLLFSECKKIGVQYIWGFSALDKLFLKAGFSIPFSISQAFLPIDPTATFKYFNQQSINKKDSLPKKSKRFLFASYSIVNSLKRHLGNKDSQGYQWLEGSNKDNQEALLPSFLKKEEYRIRQDENYLNWRVKKNPHYQKIVNFSLKNDKKGIVASAIFHIDNSGLASLIQIRFSSKLKMNVRQFFISKCICFLQEQKVILINAWCFDTNLTNKNEIVLLKKTGFTTVNKGMNFVWKILDDQHGLNPLNIILSKVYAFQ